MQLETNPTPPPVPEPSGPASIGATCWRVTCVWSSSVVGAFALMVRTGTTDIFRDISIILLAVVMIVIGLLLLVLILQIALLTDAERGNQAVAPELAGDGEYGARHDGIPE
jgi:hypothetical protein